MATETASECKIIVKKPMLLKVGDLASEFRSGVSVVDIILPGMNAVQVGKLTFKNSYTASVTVKLKVIDHAGAEQWKTLVKNYTLMPHPHLETGSQDFFVINISKMDEPPLQVIMMRLILRQPSPHWSNFGIEEIKCFLHSPMNCSSVPEWLHNDDCHNPGGIKAVQNVSNSENVASSIQQLWALTQGVISSKQNLSIGRFDIDRSYDINLLSYT